MENASKLLIFDTHPIQYRAPVFRELAKKLPTMKVCFFNSAFNGKKWWFHEVGKANSFDWGLNLTEGYTSETLTTEKWSLWTLIKELRPLLKKECPQAVLVYGYYLREHWILRLLCAQLKIPLIFVGETFSSNSSWSRRLITAPLQNYFLQGVHRFVSIGDKTEAFYLYKKIPPSKIVPGKYCIDTELFKKEEPLASNKRAELRQFLGIGETDFVLLFIGRMFERKKPQDMIALHERLLPRENIHTVMVGTGPLEGTLKSQCEELPRLHWVGFQNQTEIRNWYFAADLLVVPSEFETWGLVVNEAFSCGLPALVTETCGVAEDLVKNGQTGFIYKVGDLESALNCISQFLENPQLRNELGERARKKVIEAYRPDHFASSIFEAFTQTQLQSSF